MVGNHNDPAPGAATTPSSGHAADIVDNGRWRTAPGSAHARTVLQRRYASTQHAENIANRYAKEAQRLHRPWPGMGARTLMKHPEP